MSAERDPPPTYEQALCETCGDANTAIFTMPNSGVVNLDYSTYEADGQRPPPPRPAFVTSSTEQAAPLPRKGTPPASAVKTPALPPEPVLPATVAALAPPPTPPPEPGQAPKPKPKPQTQPQPKPKPGLQNLGYVPCVADGQMPPPPRQAFETSSTDQAAATPTTPARTSNKTAPKPKTTGPGTSAPAVNPSSKAAKSKEDRRVLIGRLYLLLVAIQLSAIGSISIFVFIRPITRWMKKDGLPLLYASIGVFLWTFFVLVIIQTGQKKVTGNGIRFIIFTFFYACLVGAISGHFATLILLAASVMMGLTYLFVAIFSKKTDINMKKGLIFVTVVVLLFIGVICIGTYFVFGLYKLWESGIGGAIAFVLCQLFTASIQLMLSEVNHGFTKDTSVLAFFHAFRHMKNVTAVLVVLKQMFAITDGLKQYVQRK